jgi:hypothetical protein
VKCWGWNQYGQLGIGFFGGSSAAPVDVVGLGSVARLWENDPYLVVDTTAPSAEPTQSPSANAAGWNNTDVVVTWNWTDDDEGSGIDAANCPTTTTSAGEGNLVAVSASCKDVAGNEGSANYTVKVDKGAPTISAAATTAPNAAGWYNGDVTVAFSCDDSLSGLASCPASQTLGGEGAAISSTSQTAQDNAGNSSASSNVITVKIDRTPPSVSLSGGTQDAATYYFGAVPVAPTCAATDNLSGLNGLCVVSGYSAAVGPHTVTAIATDKAGNQRTTSLTYVVAPWTMSGFDQPVDMNGVWNSVKNGSTVPIKFEVFAGANELTDTSIVNQPLTATQTLCNGGPVDEIELLATGSTSLRYDSGAGQFIYNWQTPKKAGYCYVVTVTLADGSSRSANVKLR